MGGRGAGSGGRYGGGGLSSSDILSTTSLISAREGNAEMVDDCLSAFRDISDKYGYVVDDIQLATLKPGANAIAYYDGANVALNKKYFDKATLERSYAACVKSGFHPSNGNKTAAEAIMSHELGHGLTDRAAAKMGITGFNKIDAAATRIVNEARGQTSHSGVVQMSRKISTYATHSNAEAIAEAFSDVYCNGSKAKRESRAIVNVLNKYL